MDKVQSINEKIEAERAELEAALASGEFGRTNNLVRLLSFVCERYFEGKIDEIKEYSIAVEALGRPRDFDPQVDTIVRVTAHALRKRLEEYYRTTGAAHPVHICLPVGHYIPKFIHRSDAVILGATNGATESNGSHSLGNGQTVGAGFPTLAPNTPIVQTAGPHGNEIIENHVDGVQSSRIGQVSRFWKAVFVFVLSALVLTGFAWYKWNRAVHQEGGLHDQASLVATSIPGNSLRAVVGVDRAPYADKSGFTWGNDNFCSGGDSFSVAGHVIQGTNDPELYSAGRRGAFHCTYPVAAGTYEVHLLFAETAGLRENSRIVGYSINGAPAVRIDVVDDAGGDDIATMMVNTDISPEKDGAIHLDFNTPDSFLNAVEIVPSTKNTVLPVRITAGPSFYRDKQGNEWLSDRYFFGGRFSHFEGDLTNIPDSHLYEWHRYGHFHYTVPVATGHTYTVKLYFIETWFGVQRGAIGGVGSRVFDVSCNGNTLLKKFDIFQEAGAGPLVKTFYHIEPTGQGKIEIYFTPRANYPSVSAIEVIPE